MINDQRYYASILQLSWEEKLSEEDICQAYKDFKNLWNTKKADPMEYVQIMVNFLAFHIPWEQNFWPKSSILIIEYVKYSHEKSITIVIVFFFISLLSLSTKSLNASSWSSALNKTYQNASQTNFTVSYLGILKSGF